MYLALCRVANVLQSRTCATDTSLRFSKGFDYATFRVFSPPSVWKELPVPLSARRPLFSSSFFFSRIMHTQKRSLINYVATPTDLLSPLERLSKFVKRLIYFFFCSFWGIENGCFLKFEAI